MEQKVNINSASSRISARSPKSRATQAGRGVVHRKRGPEQEMARLVARLAAPGIFLSPSVDGRDAWMIGLTGANPAGISLGGGVVAGADVRALISAGVLERDGAAGRERLMLSQAGRARAARDACPDAPWLAQHADLASEERRIDGEIHKVRVNHSESPLAWLRRRRDRSGEAMIDDIAFAAGERLRADMTRAQMSPRVTASWEEPTSSGNGGRSAVEPGELSVAARQRVRRALEAAGDEFAGVLMDVCGFLKGLEQVEAERGWPARSGKLILRMGLARLARHYGLTQGGPRQGQEPGGRAKAGTNAATSPRARSGA